MKMYLDHVGMTELFQELDFAYRRDIHTVLVRDDLDLLDSYLLSCLDVASEEDGRVGTFTDLFHLGV